jgi:hypothetical protein
MKLIKNSDGTLALYAKTEYQSRAKIEKKTG